jgi:hypothetical protein
MSTAINYLEDVDRFEAFLGLEKKITNKEANINNKVNSLYTYIAMKEILIDLVQELKNKYK